MKQAKVPTDSEMKRMLAVIANGRHAARNRLALALSFYAGMRVGEIASLKATDVFDDAGNVRDAIRLNAENTKANEARAVFVSARLRKEIMQYVAEAGGIADRDGPLLLTQKRTAFSAKGGGVMRFGKKEISFDDALLDMDTSCAGLFRKINNIPGVDIFSGAMQTTIIYKGFKIGGLRRTNPVFYILSGLVTDRKTEDFIVNHGFRKMLKQSKNDHHQHIWYESKTSNLNAMMTLCLDQFERIDRIFDQTK